jgi:tol-pal system protein YbgF
MFVLPILRVVRLLPLVALAAVGGCFATRSDVRVVQTDVASLRLEMVRSDAQLRADLQGAAAVVAAVADSLSKLSARMVSVQGDVRSESRAIKEQLLQIQTLLGQNEQTMRRLRAELEARNTQPAPPPSGATGMPGNTLPAGSGTTTGGTAPPATVPTNDTEGPAVLFTNGSDLLNRGSVAAARSLFQELLLKHPNSDLAPNAQNSLGESYFREKSYAAADAAFAAVLASWPTHPKAANALYKRGLILEMQNNRAAAMKIYAEVVARFPGTNEADFAAEKLKARLQ